MPDEINNQDKVTTLVRTTSALSDHLLRPDLYAADAGQGTEEMMALLREQWRRVRKHKWLILCIAIIITSITTLNVFRTKSLYQATTLVEVEKETRTLFRSADMIIQGDEPDYYFYAKALTPKLRLIQSRPVLEDAAAALKLDQHPSFLEVTQRRTPWEAVQSIFNRQEKPKPVSPETAAIATRTQILSPPEGSPQRSPAESARLAPYVNVLAGGLDASTVEETRMISISFRHTDPEMAANVANTVARAFRERNYQNKTQNFSQTSTWLNTRTRELKARLEEAELKLIEYTNSHDIYSTDGKDNLTAEKLGRLHEQATRAETERILKQSLYEEVKQGRVAQLPEAFSDARTVALQTRLGELATTSALYAGKFGPDNPRTIAVQKEVAALQKQIEESRLSLAEKLKADYERASRDEQSLRDALEKAKAETARQNQSVIQYSVLKQEVETAKSLYTDFLMKTNQLNLQGGGGQPNNITVIEPASVPVVPVSPNRPRAIMMSFLLSLALGVGLALAIEMLNSSIKTVEEVERYIGLPTLAVVPAVSASRLARFVSPRNNDSSSLIIQDLGQAGNPEPQSERKKRKLSQLTEAYTSLRTSVMLSTAGGPPQTILVTSSQPGEGKTTTSVNTALSLAQLGGEVLLIDADLRRPSVHKALKKDRTRGLTNYLSGESEIAPLIQRLETPNLHFLACGPIPPNPTELLSSERMRDLLRLLSYRFDHIVIDSPPLVSVSDAVILSTIVDGVVLVIHSGALKRSIIQRARRELQNVNARIFGVVLNKVDLKGEGYDDYYYYRYHSDYSDRLKKTGSEAI
jgi:capsular exopolysaccharide synthesis family protein